MPRTVFRRLNRGDNQDISVEKLEAPRSELLDPGSYDVEVTEARLVTSARSPGNVSIVLRLRLPDSGAVVETRPTWVSGPNANRGPMAARNQHLVSDLLAAVGIAETDYTTFTNPVLANLVGKVFAVELAIDRGALADRFNRITRVDGLVINDTEPTVLPFRSGSAAE
jgi:hypothetical protein